MKPGDLARIHARNSDLPPASDPLFDLPVDTGNKGSDVRKRTVASIRFAICPDHLAPLLDRGTGVIRVTGVGGMTEVFRPHNKVIGSGRRIPCAGSGRIAPPPTEDK